MCRRLARTRDNVWERFVSSTVCQWASGIAWTGTRPTSAPVLATTMSNGPKPGDGLLHEAVDSLGLGHLDRERYGLPPEVLHLCDDAASLMGPVGDGDVSTGAGQGERHRVAIPTFPPVTMAVLPCRSDIGQFLARNRPS